MSEIWIKSHSVETWCDPNIWSKFFGELEEILSAKLTNLDINDPPKRKVGRNEIASAGTYVTQFGPDKVSRWIFGRFKDAKVDFTIHHHKTLRVDVNDFSNSLTFFFAESICADVVKNRTIERLFDLTNECFSPFYSFTDLIDMIVKKKKSRGAVNLQQELIGVFWLTYFNGKYVEFFGDDRFRSELATPCDRGMKIKLGSQPINIGPTIRADLEAELGAKHFVDPKSSRSKKAGEAALLFSELH
ncbi:hypothetical protein [Neorhodopirellula lusitana]|uniref:hypothetical protein n=1 Tax=Neorhodopirellula lusitana TaxID=445327 RepID=UPI00384DE522